MTVVGEIRLPRRTHEVAIDPGGRAVETVVVGPGIWERAAPGPGAADIAVDFGPDDLAAAGIGAPLQLTHLPEGWILASARIEADAPTGGCSTLNLDDQPIDHRNSEGTGRSGDDDLELDVTPAGCAATAPLGDEPIDATGLTGHAFDGSVFYGESTAGRLHDDTTSVEFRSTLPLHDVHAVLDTLSPFDPDVSPLESEPRVGP